MRELTNIGGVIVRETLGTYATEAIALERAEREN